MTMPAIPYEMRLLYLQRRKTDLINCQKAFESQDFSFLEKVGHQVKGNALSYGFDDLSPIATALEAAAQEKNMNHLKVVLINFNAAVEKLNHQMTN